MALLLRRALSSKALFSLRDQRHFRTLSHFPKLLTGEIAREAPLRDHGSSDWLGFHFFMGNRRGLAKGRKSKDDGESDTVRAVPDMGPVKTTAQSQMDAGIVALARELSKLRTGRASAGMLDHVVVETGGVKLSLNHVAVVSVLDAQTLSVMPYDPNTLKAIEQAIVSSPLGINPTPDGQRLIAAIPPLTKETMQAMCKVVAKSAEDVKQSIRRARQKALDSIKKAGSSLPKDDIKRLEKEVEEMTKRSVKTADDMCKAKEKEISGS